MAFLGGNMWNQCSVICHGCVLVCECRLKGSGFELLNPKWLKACLLERQYLSLPPNLVCYIATALMIRGTEQELPCLREELPVEKFPWELFSIAHISVQVCWPAGPTTRLIYLGFAEWSGGSLCRDKEFDTVCFSLYIFSLLMPECSE